MRDALCHTGNLTLAMQIDAEKPGEIDDELCHTHSEYLRGPLTFPRSGLRMEPSSESSLILSGVKTRAFCPR
jgi:hypothetical protein